MTLGLDLATHALAESSLVGFKAVPSQRRGAGCLPCVHSLTETRSALTATGFPGGGSGWPRLSLCFATRWESSVPSHECIASPQGEKRPGARRGRAQNWPAPIQARLTPRMGTYRLDRRERPRSATAALQLLGRALLHPSLLRLALAQPGRSETLRTYGTGHQVTA